jgi:DNA-binding Lrp family transcriptional regulator
MIDAYILIQVQPGESGRQVSRQVAAIRGVDSAEDVSGPYDVIARASGRSLDELGKAVVGTIQGIDGVLRTLVCPVVRLG